MGLWALLADCWTVSATCDCDVWIEWIPLSCCISVVSLTVVEMFSRVRMLRTAHSTGASFIMVHDDRAGTFLCNYSPYLFIIFYLARSILQVDVGHNMGICVCIMHMCVSTHIQYLCR